MIDDLRLDFQGLSQMRGESKIYQEGVVVVSCLADKLAEDRLQTLECLRLSSHTPYYIIKNKLSEKF